MGAAADLEVAWGRRTPRGAMLARTGSGEPAAQDGSRRRDWFWRARLIATRGRGRDHSVVQGIPCSTSYGMVDRLLHDALLDAIGTVSLHSQGGSRSPPQKQAALTHIHSSLDATRRTLRAGADTSRLWRERRWFVLERPRGDTNGGSETEVRETLV